MKITITKKPDSRRGMYRLKVWEIKVDGKSVGFVRHEERPRNSVGKKYEVTMNVPVFVYQKMGCGVTVEKSKSFERLRDIRSYLGRMNSLEKLANTC